LTTSAPRPARGAGSDAGSVTATALVLPVVLGLVLLGAQFAVAWHAREVCQAAAQDGARAAQGTTGSAAAAEAAAAEFASVNGGTVMDDVVVSVVADGESARVTVSAEVVEVVPGWTITVHGAAGGPVERFRPAGGDG
jgi:Flp pilus assembly protein TadG